jgi:hypothetical protein
MRGLTLDRIKLKKPENVKPIDPGECKQGYCGSAFYLNFIGTGILEVAWWKLDEPCFRLLDQDHTEISEWDSKSFPKDWKNHLLPFRDLICTEEKHGSNCVC